MFTKKLACSGLCFLLATTSAIAADVQIIGGDGPRAGLGLKLPISVESGKATVAQLRWQRDAREEISWSAGLVHRQRLQQDWILGFGGHIDSTKSSDGHRFSQLSFGAELLGDLFEARANTYFPIGDTAKANSAFDRLLEADGTIRFQGGRTVAMHGADLELGTRFGQDRLGFGSFGLFAGGFAFSNPQSGGYRGVTTRAEVKIDSLFNRYEGVSLRAGLQAERVSGHTDHGAYVTLSIPLGKSRTRQKAARDHGLTQDVIRREFVTTQQGAFGALEAVTMGGRDVSAFRRVASGEDLGAAVSAAGESSVLFASGDFNTVGGLTLNDGQVLVGGGAAVTVQSASGKSMTLNNPAPAVRLSTTNTAQSQQSSAAASVSASDSTKDVVTLGNNSGVSGLTISGGRHGIAASNASDVWVKNVTIMNSADDAVMLSQVKNARLDGLTITNAGGNGVSVSDSSAISMQNVNIAKPTENGFLLRNTNGFDLKTASLSEMPICEVNSLCEFSIFSPNTVPNSGVNAIGITNATFDDITMRDVTYGFFLGSEIEQVQFSNSIKTAAKSISLSNISITNSRREAILAVAVDDLAMKDITIDNSQQAQEMDLIVLQSGGKTSLERATLKGGINGLMFVNGLGLSDTSIAPDMQINTVSIEGTSRAGIFLNPVKNIRFNDVKISKAGSHGIHILGDFYGFNGGPVTNVAFENVSVDSATTSGVNFFGPAVDVKGAVRVTNSPNDCAALVGPFYGTTLTNTDGSSLSINGSEMTTASLSGCGAPF